MSCQMSTPNGPYLLTPTAIHVHPVQEEDDRCEAAWQPTYCCQYHGSIRTSNSVFFCFELLIVFAIYPKLLNIFYFYFVAYIPQEYLPLNFQTITPWPLPRHSSPLRRPRLSSRLVRRVVPERQLVTNDRTINSAAPVAVAARPTGRTIAGTNEPTDVAPVPVDDLFAGRPKTGALKEPPVPRDRDSDDAKKPAAKPTKGRPKKVAPKTTRKPRKP